MRPLWSANNTIAAYIPNNAIIVTDYADNLKRIDRIVATLDQPPTGEPILVPVKNASALDVVTLVNRVLTENAGQPGTPVEAQQRVALVADPRSNSILVRADNPARSARVRQLIEQLDTPGRAGSNVFIVYLKNAEAAQVADMLRGLYGGGERSASPFALVLASAGAPAAMPNAVTTTTTSFGASTAATSPLVASAATGAPMAFAAGGAMVEADVANNALVIMAPEAVYNNLRAVIDRLDTRRAQVFVEALIVEVSSDKAAEFGIQWQVLTGANKNNVQGIGGTNFGARGSGQNIIDASVNLGSLGQGLNLGVINGTVSIPGLGVISNLGLLVRALENDTTANILSTPTLLTLDNEEARIIVGENVPFITGQYATTGATATIQPFQTIERRDVGPRAARAPADHRGGRTVRLGVYEEVSRRRGQFRGGAAPLEARARNIRRRRRPAGRRAGRAHPGHDERRHAEASACRRRSILREFAVPLRQPFARENEPDDLPQAHDRSRHERRPRHHDRALRLPARRAAQDNA